MDDVTRHPLLLLGLSFAVLWFFAWLGAVLMRRHGAMENDAREDFSIILAATLTLLGLIIGFTFSMAISRYDLRKSYEEAEANAIGTEYLRADLLQPEAAQSVRTLLKRYTALRVEFYTSGSPGERQGSDAQTLQVQNALWDAVKSPAMGAPNPLMALTIAGMNDVINSQGYTQAAWWNRIPKAAWALLLLIAALCNVMMGYGARQPRSRGVLWLVLPLAVSLSFFLIADIDSPRGGIIKITPQNLLALEDLLH